MTEQSDTNRRNFPEGVKAVSAMTGEQVTLAELVRERHDAGYSFREMERRARERGHKISHSSLADYANGSVEKMPDRDQIEALAAALDVGLDAVRAAAMQQYWGYVPRELRNRGKQSRIGAAIPADLSPEDEEQLLRMIQAWVASRKQY